MGGNFRRRVRQQIPFWETIQKIPETLRFDGVFPGGNQALELLGIFPGHVQALVVHGTVQIIFRGGIKLPQHLRLPGRQRFRVHGLDIRIGKQGEQLEVLDGPHAGRNRAPLRDQKCPAA